MLSAPRWTHVALPVADLDASLAWYERYTPLQTIDRRADDLGQSAWLSHPEPTDRPFVLVLVAFDDAKGVPQPQLAPFAHLGMELPSKADVDAMAERARADQCLTWEPVQLPRRSATCAPPPTLTATWWSSASTRGSRPR